MVADVEGGWEAVDPAFDARGAAPQILRKIDVVHREETIVIPVLPKSNGFRLVEWIDETHARQGLWDSVIREIEISRDDHVRPELFHESREVVFESDEIARGMADEFLGCVLPIRQIQPDDAERWIGTVREGRGGERSGECGVEPVGTADRGQKVDAQVAGRDQRAPIASIGKASRSVDD